MISILFAEVVLPVASRPWKSWLANDANASWLGGEVIRMMDLEKWWVIGVVVSLSGLIALAHMAGMIVVTLWTCRWWMGWRFTKDSDARHCWSCGYDVRGNPAGPCGECGAELGYTKVDSVAADVR